LEQPTAPELVRILEKAGVRVSIDNAVRRSFEACVPDWKSINNHTVRGWKVLESIKKAMPIKSQWVKTNDSYMLISDNPLHRARFFWYAGLVFAAAGLGWLAWYSSQAETRMGKPPEVN
jgi:hypothetical protein